MRDYKTNEEKATPMNTCASTKLVNDFLIVATDLNMGETLSKAVQLAMKYIISNKNDKELMRELQKLK